MKEYIIKVKSIVFTNEDNAYCIFKGIIMVVNGKTMKQTAKTITLLGNVLNLRKGDVINVSCEEIYKIGKGYQYKLLTYNRLAPGTIAELKKFIKTFKGIGDKGADALLEEHGLDVIKKIEDSYESLNCLNVSSDIKVSIRSFIMENKAYEEVLAFLLVNKLDQEYAIKVFRKYKDTSMTVLRNAPFQVYLDGIIDFKTADYLCFKQGVEYNNQARVEIILFATLSESSKNRGNLFENYDSIGESCIDFLSNQSSQYTENYFTKEEIDLGIAGLKTRGSIIIEDKIEKDQL